MASNFWYTPKAKQVNQKKVVKLLAHFNTQFKAKESLLSILFTWYTSYEHLAINHENFWQNSFNVAVPRELCFIYLTNTSNKRAFYGVKGGTPLRNRRDRRTSIAWPNAKLISPVNNSALDQTSRRGQKLARSRSITLNGTTSWPPVSIVLECGQISSLTYLPSTTSRLCRHVLDRTRRGMKEH